MKEYRFQLGEEVKVKKYPEYSKEDIGTIIEILISITEKEKVISYRILCGAINIWITEEELLKLN